MSSSQKAEPQQAPKLKHYPEAWAFKSLWLTMSLLGFDRASRLMGWLWRTIAPRTKRHTRALTHMEWAMPDTSPEQREMWALDMWRSLGRTFAEGLLAHKIVNEQSRLTYDPDEVEVWRQEGANGSLLLTLHQGNWEMATLAAKWLAGVDIAGVYKPLANPLMDKIVRDVRGTVNKGALLSSKSNAALGSARILRGGGSIAFLVDLRDSNYPPVSFFGMAARLPSFPIALALKQKKPLFIFRVLREGEGQFRLELKKIEPDASENLEDRVLKTHQKVITEFEGWVRNNPDQFMWAHNRWSGSKQTLQGIKPDPL